MDGNTINATHDPVCGMTVDPATAKHRAESNGVPYFFCSASCQAKFAANPEHYLHALPSPTPLLPADVIYTCPMHPQIRRDAPGFCPICGMALEPLAPTADPGPNPELRDMTRRFWIGAVLAAPVFVLAMSAHAGLHNLSSL